MKTGTSLHHLWCSSNRGTKPTICQRDTEITKRPSCFTWILLAIAVLSLMPLAAISQEDHGSGGGGGGCGDVFGDLIHILRNEHGQPILAKRWVELPAAVQGYGWGYCPIAVYTDEDGDQQEIPFLPNSCDYNLLDENGEIAFAVEEVDYFGRLNGGRTKERNNRMHFNEVISNIKQAEYVTTDEMGRLKMGFGGCAEVQGEMACYEWASVDSPMESMGLYSRIMRYAHIGTDPYEVDYWSHGDPKRPTQFNPSLTPEDWAKFDDKLVNLKPRPTAEEIEACYDYGQAEDFTDVNDDGKWTPYEPFFDKNDNCIRDEHEPFTDLDFDEAWDPGEVFTDTNGNCVRDEFVYLCAAPQSLDNADFVSGATVLSAAASKTGWATRDLVQYMNRILKITQKTTHTEATLDTLPALIRDCYDGVDPPFPDDHEYVYPDDELVYVCDEGDEPYAPVIPMIEVDGKLVFDCLDGTPNHCLFPDVQEQFVDFSELDDYLRTQELAEVLYQKKADKKFETLSDDPLIDWVENVNGEDYDYQDIDGFVNALNDMIRTIEYVHNYRVPENLFIKYGLEDPR